jgi:hypothetical protein
MPRYVYHLKNALDALRTARVDAVIKIARDAVKDSTSYPAVVNVALALTYLLREASYGSPSSLRGIVSFTDLTAKRICMLGGVQASSAMCSSSDLDPMLTRREPGIFRGVIYTPRAGGHTLQ